MEHIGGSLAADALPKSSRAKIWSIPLMTPAQSTNVEQEITIDSAEPIAKVGAGGAFELNPTEGKADKAPTSLQLRLGRQLASARLDDYALDQSRKALGLPA